MSNDAVTILYDHYKDSCTITGAAVKRRDRLMIFVIVAIGLFSLQALSPSKSSQVVSQLLNSKLGLTIQLNLALLGDLVWFSLLLFTLRYFQTQVFIERQYSYLHQIEEKLNKELGDEIVTREGKGYLFKYPAFSNWISILYTIAFPMLLLIVTSAKIIGEWIIATSYRSLDLLASTLIFVLLVISTVLYLIVIHRKV
jgi:hypothetical protein